MTTVSITTGDRVPLLIDSSDDIDYEVTYRDDDVVVIDITGYTFEWVFTVGEVTLTATVLNGRLTLEEEDGLIVLHIPANTVDDDDNPLPQGLGEHRLRATSPVVKTLMRGALTNDT
jgi:hypothetical protein